MSKEPVYQRHHVIYKSDKNKEVTRRVRKGVHQILTLLKRFNYLEEEEINAIILECGLRRRFNNEIGAKSKSP